MKVLQTLGLHQNVQEGIFAYKRDADGVLIDGSVGHSIVANGTIRFSHAQWTAILQEIANLTEETLRLSRIPVGDTDAPHTSLYTLLDSAVPTPTVGAWNDSWRAYVCAILEHEGSIDLYAGPLGRGAASARIYLSRSS